MSQWDGKSKGTLLGYKIFVFLIKKLGVRAAYGLLIFVSFYYFLFSPKSFRAIYYYLRQRQGYGIWKALWNVYQTYFVFGQTIIDKVAISSGLRGKYTYQFDGIDILKEVLAKKRGGILISAHVGNFEIADKFFADIDVDLQINLVAADQERTIIKEYIKRISEKPSVKFIHIQEDMSHVFAINEALSNNELICFTGDRYFDGAKTLTAPLLGKVAHFPAGPFRIASRLSAPVIFVYVMRESGLRYHLYARRAVDVKQREPHAVLAAYTSSVEGILQKYPLQWFNFFDFWK
ncbi:LpxL/LpxP family acyltransferase [Sphingobacterium haloxyli]|uniref:Lipid A biosynthesis acyltransferase n=1 Tax=Sphingobacterium haloxyli TaxID=2100533 RepID=A0A2S9J813_9SPHI|nr:lipid A biosynthesis acyltransferase [Sphingobacterium haloxyli]PRD48935.1 lipid A biosynthesis acyltransferase [Sphingobacterium haloxyli]